MQHEGSRNATQTILPILCDSAFTSSKYIKNYTKCYFYRYTATTIVQVDIHFIVKALPQLSKHYTHTYRTSSWCNRYYKFVALCPFISIGYSFSFFLLLHDRSLSFFSTPPPLPLSSPLPHFTRVYSWFACLCSCEYLQHYSLTLFTSSTRSVTWRLIIIGEYNANINCSLRNVTFFAIYDKKKKKKEKKNRRRHLFDMYRFLERIEKSEGTCSLSRYVVYTHTRTRTHTHIYIYRYNVNMYVWREPIFLSRTPGLFFSLVELLLSTVLSLSLT